MKQRFYLRKAKNTCTPGIACCYPNAVFLHSNIASFLDGKEILVVEDSYLNREIISKILRRNKIKPVTVASGEEAITVLKRSIQRKKPFALVLLDITLPGNLDGFDVAEYIKNNPRLSQIEIIVISKSQKVCDRERLQQLGVSRFYPKPLSEKDLMDCIRDVLSIKRSKSCNNNREVPADKIASVIENDKHNILLVEDNRINREIASGMLTKRGHKVIFAKNGVEAVNSIGKAPFDIILMDIQMPEKNGYEATREIREKEQYTGQHTYIIGLTANALQGDREKCLDEGMDDYISKPVRSGELENAIERYRQYKLSAKVEAGNTTDVKPKVNVQRLFNDLNRDLVDMEKILSLFEEDVLRLLKDIELTVKAGKMTETSILLHSLRGQCDLVDMHTVGAIAQDMEVLAANNQSSKVEQILPVLSREVREALNEMQVIRIML